MATARCLFLAVVTLLQGAALAAPLSEHFSAQDAKAYAETASKILLSSSSSIADKAESTRLLAVLGKPTGSAGAACGAAAALLQQPTSLADVHYAAEVAKALSCSNAEASSLAIAVVKRGSDSQELGNLYHAALAAQSLGEKVDFGRIVRRVAALVDDDGTATSLPEKEDASVANAAMVADLLARVGSAAGDDAASYVKAAIEQMTRAFLSDKGGDATLLLGPLSAAGGQLPATAKAKYLKRAAAQLLAARHTRNPTAMLSVYQGLKAVAAHPKAPLCVVLSPPVATATALAAGEVSLLTLDLFGGAAEVREPALVALAAAGSAGSAGNVKETPLSTGGAGRWKLAAAGVAPGVYAAEIRLVLGAEDNKPTAAHLPLVVTAPATVEDIAVTVKARGGAGIREMAPPLPSGASADATASEQVQVCFAVAGAVSHPHQAMVRFVHEETELDAFFVAVLQTQMASKYCASVDIAREMSTFEQRSGAYQVSILVGDAALEAPLRQPVGKLALKFPPVAAPHWPLYTRPLLYESDSALSKLPEKHHTFRQPEPRPPFVVSAFFTLVVLLPLLGFLLALPRLGGNLRGLPSGAGKLYYASYQLCIGATLALFAWYWVELTMVRTLTILAPLLLVTGALGRKGLMSLAGEEATSSEAVDAKKTD